MIYVSYYALSVFTSAFISLCVFILCLFFSFLVNKEI